MNHISIQFLIDSLCEPYFFIAFHIISIYEGDVFTNILLDNYKQQQDSPNSSLTFEDLVTQWYKDFLVQGHTAADNTGFDIGIFTAYGIVRSSDEMSPSLLSPQIAI